MRRRAHRALSRSVLHAGECSAFRCSGDIVDHCAVEVINDISGSRKIRRPHRRVSRTDLPLR